MPVIPTCQPDGPKIRGLIRERGYSVSGFARKIGRPQSARSMRNICTGRTRISVEFLRQVARGLGVRPGEISDWKGDDNVSEPETPDRLSA